MDKSHMDNPIDLQLMEAVTYCDTQIVKDCLEKGANPNYTQFKDEDEPNGLIQPTTPLRMVMFRISDNDLDEKDLIQYGEIARLLLANGADPKPAMQIAESRYGKYDPNMSGNLFLDVWHIVAGAMKS